MCMCMCMYMLYMCRHMHRHMHMCMHMCMCMYVQYAYATTFMHTTNVRLCRCDCSVGSDGSRALYCSTYGWCGDTDEHRGGLPEHDCAHPWRAIHGEDTQNRIVGDKHAQKASSEQGYGQHPQDQQQEAECGPTVGIKCGQLVFNDGYNSGAVREFPI